MTTRPDAHRDHDPDLIASLLDREAGGPDRDRATALVTSCNACARLHADLVALTAAVRVQPTPARPRDFSITPEDAARLRRGRGWRRLLALGGPRDRLTRPLALGLTTLGVAGLLLANIQVPV